MLAEPRRAGAIDLAARRDRLQQPGVVLDGVGRGRHAALGEPRRDQPGLRGATQVERLGHRPEIGDHAAGERGRDADRVARPCGIEPAQHCGGRGGGHRTEHGTGVPALAVMLVLVARDQLGPHLVARDIGRDHGLAVGTAFLRLRQDRGHQHGAGMAAERGVVEIEHVRGDRVEHRAVARRHAQAGGRERMLRQRHCRQARPRRPPPARASPRS